MSDPVGPTPGAGAPGAGHQAKVDATVQQVRSAVGEARRPLFKPPPPHPGPSAELLDHRLAEELQYVRRHLDLLGDALSSDGVLLRRYAQQLQSIDMMNQLLDHLARIISADDKTLAIEQSSFPDLRNRLLRKAIRSISE